MLRTVQIDVATQRVVAVVRPSGELVAAAGMLFFEIDDETPDPCGMYYVAGEFQTDAP